MGYFLKKLNSGFFLDKNEMNDKNTVVFLTNRYWSLKMMTTHEWNLHPKNS